MEGNTRHDHDPELLERLLDELLLWPALERTERLAKICTDNPELADELRSRLKALLRFGLIDPPQAGGGPAPDSSFGPYHIVRELASGGMGTVYLAHQIEPLQREVALKLIGTDRLLDERSRKRFAREAAVLARFEHPVFCPVYDSGVIDGCPFLTMRYVDGATLAVLVDRARRDPAGRGGIALSSASGTSTTSAPASLRSSLEAVIALFEKLARGLAALHDAGFLHRDLKPGNIMLDHRGEPVILDLGLAKAIDASAGEPSSLTLSGATLGTPAYMAPEQVRGVGTVDARTDVYGLGATLYECLALRPPFEQTDREALFHDIVTATAPDLRQLNRHVPRDLAVVVAKTVEKEPRRRYASATELADELARVRDGNPVRARPAGPLRRFAVWRRARPATAHGLMALVALLLVCVGFLIALRQKMREAQAFAWSQEAAALIDRDPARARRLARNAYQQHPCATTLSQLWNTRAADRLFEELETSGPITGCLWSPDGTRLLCLGEWGSFSLYARNGRCLLPPVRLVPENHAGQFLQPTTSAAWAEDRFAVASREGVVSVRSLVDGAELWSAILDAPPLAFLLKCTKIPGIAWSHSGRELAVATRSGRIQRFDGAGKELPGFETGTTNLTSLHWRPGSDQLLTTGWHAHATLWHADGTVVRDLASNGEAGFTVARFFPDGHRVVLGTSDGLVLVHDLTTDQRTEFHGLDEIVTAVAVAPDGEHVAAASTDQRALFWHSERDVVVAEMTHGLCFDLEFSPDGQWIALGEYTGRVRVCDRNGHLVYQLPGHTESVNDVEFGPDGLLASTSDAQFVRLWQLQGTDYRVLPGHRNAVQSVRWREPQRLLSASFDGDLRIFDPASGRSNAIPAGQGALWSLGMAPDGTSCATGSVLEGSVNLWALPPPDSNALPELSKPLRSEPPPHGRVVHSIEYSADNRHVVTAGSDGTVRVWSREGQLLIEIGEEGGWNFMMAAVDRQSSRLATMRFDGELTLYRIDLVQGTKDPVWDQPLRFDSIGWSVEFAPDDRALLVGLGDGTARLLELTAAGAPEAAVLFGHGEERHAGAVHKATFSPDGTLVLTGSFDGTLSLWRTDGTLIATLDYGASVETVGFSPDGKEIYAAGSDRVIKIWPTPPGSGW